MFVALVLEFGRLEADQETGVVCERECISGLRFLPAEANLHVSLTHAQLSSEKVSASSQPAKQQ